MLGLCEIDSFHHVLPKNIYQQSDITNWMAEYNLQQAGEVESASLFKKRFERFSVSPDKIAQRGLEFVDINSFEKRDYDQEKNTKMFSKRDAIASTMIFKVGPNKTVQSSLIWNAAAKCFFRSSLRDKSNAIKSGIQNPFS